MADDIVKRLRTAPPSMLGVRLEAADLIEAQQAEIERLLALLGHAAKNLTAREVENDEQNDDIIRLLIEVGQLRAHVDRLLLAGDALSHAIRIGAACDPPRYCSAIHRWEEARRG